LHANEEIFVPKKIPTDFAEKLAAAVGRHPDGIAAGRLSEALGKGPSRRSLARYLDRLVNEKKLVVRGVGKATRYFPAPKIPTAAQPDRLGYQAEVYVPMTGESETLRDWVRRPITQRRPVGYDRTLLDAYEPNKTFYLSDADWRARLREIGRAPTAVQAAGTYARDILNRLLIDLSWASSHLEGNTYSRLDTQNLIEHGKAAEGKDALETQMILNHKQAIEFLVEHAAEIGFDMYTFMNLHALLSRNLLGDPADEGRLRSRIVDIGGTVYLPLQVPQQIEELFRLVLQKAGAITDPFEQSFFLMVHIPYLQPFVDVNKRVSRLAANIPFIKGNLCPLSFVDVPERAYVDGTLSVYEHARVDLLRDVFVWAYERSCQTFKAVATTLPKPDPFRLKFRVELEEAVGELVRPGSRLRADALERVVARLVASQDRDRFASMLAQELGNLHEGNIARYRLRLAEYRAWRAKNPAVR
jgi:hypothetical protein